MSKGALTSFSLAAITRSAAVALLGTICAASVNAADLTWGGLYRFEGVKIQNPELASANTDKAYALHHLVLTPKIIAADGLTIYSRFDLFNNPTWGANQQFGEVLGSGVNPTGNPNGPSGAGTSTGGSDSNAVSRSGAAGDLAVTTLYASWVQEFGQFVVGRAPLHFGLGVAYNAGNGMFDHYLDTRDMVGYKFVLGNLFFMPILAKVNEGSFGKEDDVNDYLFHFQYDNPDTELSLGVLYGIRVGTFDGNDFPRNGEIGGGDPATPATLSTRTNGYKTTLISLYSSQKTGDATIAVEANLLSGDTGLTTPAQQGVAINSYGIAGEVNWAPAESKWKGALKLGVASGDDPGTADTYEGFIFSRNYDVGMLMFNHPLGDSSADFFRTGLIRKSATGTQAETWNQPDTEAISNVIYIAPSVQHQWKENLSWGGTLVYGRLNKESIPGKGMALDLGFELDLNLTYKPYERLTWVTEVGALMPGSAWQAGSNNFENKFNYGVITKAAISF